MAPSSPAQPQRRPAAPHSLSDARQPAQQPQQRQQPAQPQRRARRPACVRQGAIGHATSLAADRPQDRARRQRPARRAPACTPASAHQRPLVHALLCPSGAPCAEPAQFMRDERARAWANASGRQGRSLPSSFSPSPSEGAREPFSTSASGSGAALASPCRRTASRSAACRCSTYASAARGARPFNARPCWEPSGTSCAMHHCSPQLRETTACCPPPTRPRNHGQGPRGTR